MTVVLFGASLLQIFFGSTMFLSSLFLILLVLVQRGRGGGLTGALGGMGGQSAFGTKAGDTFTRVTMVTAAVWILLCIGAIMLLGSDRGWGESSGGTEITGSSMNGSDTETDDMSTAGETDGADGGATDSTSTEPTGSDATPTSDGTDVLPGGSGESESAAPDAPTE